MKTLRRKLFLSILAVAFAVVSLATSTFAWFSMNTEVTATGMQVDVKSNNAFLLINTGENDTAAEIQAAKLVTIPLTVSDEQAVVFPSKPLEASEIGSGKLFAEGTPVTDQATAAVAANWYTAYNNNPAASTDSVKNAHLLNTTVDDQYEFSKYVIKRTAYITLAQGSDAAHNLTVNATIAKKDGETAENIAAVRVLVVTQNNNMAVLKVGQASASLHTTDFDITDTSVVTVDIYIYYDGSDSAVTTNNAANLAAATVSLAFDVEVKQA